MRRRRVYKRFDCHDPRNDEAMRTCLAPLLAVAVLANRCVEVRAAEPVAAMSAIRVPAGFIVERVAAVPLVEHPLMASFDDRGRLYVADNAGLNLPMEQLQKQLPNM